MAKEVVIPNQGIRERHLNIVYFIDSSKSHSIRVNLCLARWLFAGAVGLVLWSLLSVGWIISLDRVLRSTRQHLSHALTSIFDYQVKYDRVFDLAYPENSTQGYYASGSHLPANNPTDAEKAKVDAFTKTNSKPGAPAAVASSVKPGSTTAVTPASDASVGSAAANTNEPTAVDDKQISTGLAMEIRNPSLTARNGKMTLLFDIVNKNHSQKAEGYIWAITTIQHADGSTKTIAAPAHSRLNQEGAIDAFSTTYKFSIQKFKRKDFTFAVPNDESWKVAGLKITYVDSQGKQNQSIPVTIPVKFSKPDQAAASDDNDPAETGEDAAQQ